MNSALFNYQFYHLKIRSILDTDLIKVFEMFKVGSDTETDLEILAV